VVAAVAMEIATMAVVVMAIQMVPAVSLLSLI